MVVFPQDLGFGKDAYFDDEGRQLSDRLTDAVIAFATEPSNRPFFAYYADHAVHAPFESEADLLAKYEQKAARLRDGRNDPAYAATIEAVDRNIGRIMQAVTSQGITENTLVIFTSDNGGTASYTPPLAGGKGQLYEGGIRVPLAMWWPGTIRPGLTSAEPVASIDFYSTLVELAGLVPQSQLDGASLVPLLSGKRLGESRPLFWHFPCYIGKSTPSSAVREGDYKLIEFFEDGGHVELYNLRKDPGESNHLASTEPAKASALASTLRTWQSTTQAAIPTQPNPAYDPAAERPRGRQQGDGGQSGKGGRKGGQRKQRQAG